MIAEKRITTAQLDLVWSFRCMFAGPYEPRNSVNEIARSHSTMIRGYNNKWATYHAHESPTKRTERYRPFALRAPKCQAQGHNPLAAPKYSHGSCTKSHDRSPSMSNSSQCQPQSNLLHQGLGLKRQGQGNIGHDRRHLHQSQVSRPSSYTIPQISSQYWPTVIDGECWKIPAKYRFNRILGKGAYGCVAEFYDTELGRKVAIKRISEVFRELADSKRILREIHCLRHLRNCDSVTKLIGLFHTSGEVNLPNGRAEVGTAENGEGSEWSELYMVLEAMDCDLGQIISGSSVAPLSIEHLRFLFHDLLRAFAIIHRANIIHRDVKPSNLLVNLSACTLKVCDFGLSRYFGPTYNEDCFSRATTASSIASRHPDVELDLAHHAALKASQYESLSAQSTQIGLDGGSDRRPIATVECSRRKEGSGSLETACVIDNFACGREETSAAQAQPMTEYIITRWYRPPEVLLNCGHYDTAVDLWGVACVMCEVLLGRPLFPGNNNVDQLERICKVLGRTYEFEECIRSGPVTRDVEQVRKKLQTMPIASPQDPFTNLFPPSTDRLLIDLMRRLLVINPRKRWSAEHALAHPFFKPLQRNDTSLYPHGEICPQLILEPRFRSDTTLKDLIYASQTMNQRPIRRSLQSHPPREEECPCFGHGFGAGLGVIPKTPPALRNVEPIDWAFDKTSNCAASIRAAFEEQVAAMNAS